jgi:hypothetical protein
MRKAVFVAMVAATFGVASPASAADPTKLGKQFGVFVSILEYPQRRQSGNGTALGRIVTEENRTFVANLLDEVAVPIGRNRSKIVYKSGLEVKGRLAVLNDGIVALDFKVTVDDQVFRLSWPAHSKRYLVALRPGQTAKLHFQRTSDRRQIWVQVRADAVKE